MVPNTRKGQTVVEDRARTQAARAQVPAPGLSHPEAARHHDPHRDEAPTSIGVHTALMHGLQAAGWPVEYETIPENVQYRGYAGPARLTVGRAGQVTVFGTDDPDPDDADRLDVSQPPLVAMAAPLSPEGFEVHCETPGSRPIHQIIGELTRMLTEGRAHAVAQARNDARCTVCGDSYPAAHLLAAAGDERLPLCPVCAFDGDVFVTGNQATAYLAYQIDQLEATDLAMPAGWAGPTALLGYAAADGFADRLQTAWREAGTFFVPSPQWAQPELIWVWLPPGDRPVPLDRFGAGARLGALVSALDMQIPELRQRARDVHAENQRDAGIDDASHGQLLEQMWPVAVAYAVSLQTQAVERVQHRAPLEHLLGSFDALRDHLTLVESALDFDDVESALSVGITVISEALWPRSLQPAW